MKFNTAKKAAISNPMRWFLVSLSMSILVVMLYALGLSYSFDIAVLQDVAFLHSPFLTRLLYLITLAGNGYFLAPFGILIVLAAYFLRYRLESIALLVTLAGCEIWSETLKVVFTRPRPVGFHLIDLPGSYSMPSGHALVGGAFYTMLVLLCYQYIQHKPAGKWVGIIGIGFVFLLCASRVYLGVHYPSDVLAGYFLGLSWMFLVYHFYSRILNRSLAPKKPQDLPAAYDLN